MRLPDLRPLDPVRSLKAKLGLLVVASCGATALVLWSLLVVRGWLPRYTVPVSILVALGVTQVLAHGMTRPLRQMTAAAQAMAEGRPAGPIQSSSRDEVGDLARAFTSMAADLAAAENQRKELLSNVGHELRTPVAGLQAQLENLVDGVTPTTAATLDAALTQTNRLADLVEDLLSLAQSGETPLLLQNLSMRVAIDDAVDEVASARPGHEWEVDVEPADLKVHADPARLRQILINLLDNSARHGQSQSPVRVAATSDDSCVTLTVADDGPGISPAIREGVFDRFTRGETGDSGGTGLGLAIASWATALHGGRIRVLDTTVGCTIQVDLPRSAS